ncbi:acetate--CoA ligase family protein [Nocardioides alcanivorans]|uniref:acetate--CoA ligase family protein n=1 Tax=Nocardioides alcanivorans TaxID=2897352 RepID=UPI001F3B92C9|nr:acetate--CoA ligase family protein [Nocardioides alcanivorans]
MKHSPVDLDRLFHPLRVAVIGASETEGHPATGSWRRVRDWAGRMGAEAVPVNPKRSTVDGVDAFAAIGDVPGEIDVAVILIGDVATALEQVARSDAKFAIVFAAGFAETGDEGVERQAELESLIRDSGLRVLGPNTNMNLFETFREDLGGPAIALITQSGHQGRPVFQGQELGIRFSHWAPTGNEMDLDAADFVSYFAEQPATGAIAAYLEGFRDGPAFLRAAAAAAERSVPIVAVKVGRTEMGKSWAQSHTGHLAGTDAVTEAAFRQFGIARVDGLDELLDTSMLLARAQAPTADGVCVYSISGGTSAHMADLLTGAGINIPELSPTTQEALRQWIPDYLRTDNPVDSGGAPVGDERGRRILDALLADPAIGVLVVPIAGVFPPLSDRLVADLIAVAETTDKPVCVIWGSPAATEDAYRTHLLGSDVPVFRTSANCVTALRSYFDHHRFLARGQVEGPPSRDSAPVPGPTLNEVESKQLLEAYGVTVTRDVLAQDVATAVAAATEIGMPVVMKAASAQIAHKSDHGLVRIGIQDSSSVAATFRQFVDVVASVPSAELDGVLVAEQVIGGVETVVGLTDDEVFGPVVMFGMGGTAVEVYRDVSFRIPPFDRDEAHRMVRELRGSVLLTGHRGAPPTDLEAIVDVIMAVQRIAQDGEIIELDVNPLLALPDRAVALDAMARRAAPPGGQR